MIKLMLMYGCNNRDIDELNKSSDDLRRLLNKSVLPVRSRLVRVLFSSSMARTDITPILPMLFFPNT